jgi:arylsulfatase A
LNRRTFLKTATAATLLGPRSFAQSTQTAANPPNIIVILADDLGYGDLSCYGSDIGTPNIDAMAASGVRFNHFYSASPVCSPSRAALLTGRYPTRVGVPGVLMSDAPAGLSLAETTIPQVLKQSNYATACIGKWHLGTRDGYKPKQRGFDEFYGLPYSNDMWPLPLIDGTTTVEEPAEQSTLTARYTDRACDFIGRNKSKPFFLYMAHTFPHIPLAASPKFKGKSGKGLYGDCIQELDWSVGQVLNSLKANRIDQNTLVLFTSDNGPWFQGSAGKLRGRKGETFEGGMREPFVAVWPGRIKAGRTVNSLATMMDLLPTFAGMANAALPQAPLDGVDILPVLTGDADTVDRPMFFYFDGWNLQCARLGRFKLHMARNTTPPWLPPTVDGRMNLPLSEPELYDLESDPDESHDIASERPDITWMIYSKTMSAIPTFPQEVQDAWNSTMATPVNNTTPGGWPSVRN